MDLMLFLHLQRLEWNVGLLREAKCFLAFEVWHIDQLYMKKILPITIEPSNKYINQK